MERILSISNEEDLVPPILNITSVALADINEAQNNFYNKKVYKIF
jgi:hypothetical protein